jgi:hypothetical protein
MFPVLGNCKEQKRTGFGLFLEGEKSELKNFQFQLTRTG